MREGMYEGRSTMALVHAMKCGPTHVRFYEIGGGPVSIVLRSDFLRNYRFVA